MGITDITTRIVAICDDEEIYRTECRNMCEAYSRKSNQKIEILEFVSAEELMKNKKKLHLVFLDIEMPGLSGIDAKNILAKTQPDSYIIFMTNYSEYMSRAFGKNVCYFLKKPLRFEEVYHALKQICQEQAINEDFIVINNKRIILSQVIYLKGEDKYVRFIIYNEDSVLVRGTMTEWTEKLKEKFFFRVQKSYIINFQWINYIEHNVYLKNKESVPISKNVRKKLQEEYLSFLNKMAY